MSLQVAILALVTAACAGSPPRSATPVMTTSQAQALTPVSERAARVYREAIVVDAHNDMPTKVLDEGYDPDVRHAPEEGHTDLPRLVESGITAQFLVGWVNASYAAAVPDQSYERATAYLDSIHAFVARHPGELLFATTAADVRRAKQQGKVAVLIAIEGGHAIEASLENLRELYRRGARYLTLTWNNGNQWAGSSLGVSGTRTGGLTPFGREVIHEMNRIGMLVDVSHASDSTFFDVLETSTAPVIASHSSARALSDHPRNLTDEQLRAVARSGGVVNVNFFSRFLDPRMRQAMDDVEARIRAAADSLRTQPGADRAAAEARTAAMRRAMLAELPPTPLSVLVDHLDHVARVAGIDHVGIGSDFDGINAVPEGMEDVTRLPRIAQALLDRGYSEGDVKKVLGGNMMRVMQEVLDRHAAPD